MSEIMLATTFDAKKLKFPVEVSVKLDGVAADFYKTPNGWLVQSRQGKPVPSVAHILRYLNTQHKHADNGLHIIGELTVMGVDDFKDAGGIIRRQVEDRRIVLNIYDIYTEGTNETYATRRNSIDEFVGRCLHSCFITDGTLTWSMVKRVPVTGIAKNIDDLNMLIEGIEGLMETSHLFEGFMIRCLQGKDSEYRVGKRSKGMMRFKPKPTVDIPVIRFEEAHANKDMTFMNEEFKKGDGLRAVGRIVCEYKGEEIGVGPGTLTHADRRNLWEGFVSRGKPDLRTRSLIAEVEYMLDHSYKALRQPIFKRWRLDKNEASEEG